MRLRLRRRPRKLKPAKFNQRWLDLQKLCANKETWPEAIIVADDLLKEALKKRRYRGKTPGERLVAAQHELTSNDTVWFGHKLRNRLESDSPPKLKKQDVLAALAGFRQALRDMGALDK
jgi:hypothetical protein